MIAPAAPAARVVPMIDADNIYAAEPVCVPCTAAYELTGDDERAFTPAVAELVVGTLRVALCAPCAFEATR